jgi:hypothetical protein
MGLILKQYGIFSQSSLGWKDVRRRWMLLVSQTCGAREAARKSFTDSQITPITQISVQIVGPVALIFHALGQIELMTTVGRVGLRTKRTT